jgi:hypothetical protein
MKRSYPVTEKEFLCPFPGTMTDGITVCHPVHFVSIPRVHVVVRNNCWFYSISMLITVIAFCGWSMHFSQHRYVSFVFQTNVVNSPLILTFMSPFFIRSLLLHKSCSSPFRLGLVVPQQLIFSSPACEIWQ